MIAPPPLAVVPTYLRTAEELDVLLKCLVSLRVSAPACDVLVVDDESPAAALVDQLDAVTGELGVDLTRRPENGGFARTVNVGLAQARAEGRDAILVNADVEFPMAGWLEALLARTDTEGRPAAVVGGLLLFPSGLIQHAGVYFSLLTRGFDHRFRYAPASLPEAHVPSRCPVTAALQLIRHECLETVGLYDEAFRLGFEDVDYCLRVFASGLESIYEPAAMAIHHESLFRGTPTPRIAKWQQESLELLRTKHAETDFGPWVPAVL